MENLKRQIQVAVDALKSQRILEAEELTKKLISENPNIVFLYNLLGLILVQQKKFDQALECYKKGIEVDPNFAMIYNNIGVLFFKNRYSGNAKKIEDFYTNLPRGEECHLFWYYLGKVCDKADMISKAQTCLDTSKKLLKKEVNKISNPSHKTSFLQNRILHLAITA